MKEIYADCDDDWQQGDIFVLDTGTREKYGLIQEDVTIVGFLLVSNSCDIVNEDIQQFLFCPIVTISSIVRSLSTELKSSGVKGPSKTDLSNLRSRIHDVMGYKHKTYFFLPKKDKVIGENSAALLEHLIALKRESVLADFASGRRITLASPWRENLGWRVGNLFNRVALNNHSKKLSMK